MSDNSVFNDVYATPVKSSSYSESAFRSKEEAPDCNLITSDGHHNLPPIDDYHKKKCCTTTCWGLVSQLCFLGGAICYIVNGAGWTYLEVIYGSKAVTDDYYVEQKRIENGTKKLNTYNYYLAKYEEIEGQFSWWEIAGAVLFLLNPIVDFIDGALAQFCAKTNPELLQKVRPKCLYCVPWDSVGAVFFFIGSSLYMTDVFISRAKFAYDEVYEIIDFFAVAVFVLDAVAYILGRVVRIQLAANTPQAKALYCGGPAWTGMVSLDYGFYGDILFLIGALVEVVDHFHYNNGTNLLAQSLWALDAILYLVEWVLVNTTPGGLRFSERSTGKRYSGVSNISRRRSLLARINSTTSINGGTRPASLQPNTPPNYGSAIVQDC